MIALIDADVLRYEIASIGENNGPDQPEPMWFDRVAEYLDQRISQIMFATEAVSCLLFLTGPGNFRDKIAVSKPYKGNRKPEKPFHFDNLTAYMKSQYDTRVAEGMEADDLMSVMQMQSDGATVICTRDKDLRMIPGWHYGWECGAQPEYHMRWVSHGGSLELTEKGKLVGTGMMFFYSQLLTGDAVDNIPGLPGVGPAKAYNLLKDAEPEQALDIVREAYLDKGYDDEYLLEQGQLLWMTRALNEDGTPVLWTID
jgi:hypothetical protein